MQRFNLVKYSTISLSVSGLLVAASLVCVAIFGLNFGIDFTGGSIMDVHVDGTSTEALHQTVVGAGFEPTVQSSDEGHYFIRLHQITEQEHQTILTALKAQYPDLTETRFDVVGPVVGEQLKNSSIRAVIILLVLIALYIAWAFRKVSQPVASWKYGLVTVLVAFHDIIIPLGAFAVLGHFFGYQLDTAFIAAILTILGYSINDTIVVFDRTRENLFRHRHGDITFAEVVNQSVIETFARSINTTLATLLPLFAIFFVGGETTRPFVLALIIGIFAGAYSSIFVASPLVVFWERWQHRSHSR